MAGTTVSVSCRGDLSGKVFLTPERSGNLSCHKASTWPKDMKLMRFTDSGGKQGIRHVKYFFCFVNSYIFLISPFVTASGFISMFAFQVLTNIFIFRVFITYVIR